MQVVSKSLRSLRMKETAGAADAHTMSAERFHALVCDSPGLPVGAIVRRLGLGAGTVQYHLHRLNEKGVIRTVAVGRRTLVFPRGAFGQDLEARGLSLLYGRTCRAIAEAIVRRRGASVTEICAETGKSHRVVYYHVKLLMEAGLVVSASPTRFRNLTPAPRLVLLLSCLVLA